jgi:hypothetical protein
MAGLLQVTDLNRLSPAKQSSAGKFAKLNWSFQALKRMGSSRSSPHKDKRKLDALEVLLGRM